MASKADLIELLNQGPLPAFRPYVDYTEESDAANFYFKPDADYSERLTDHVTLFRSLATNDLVGCRIKGVAGILADLPNYIDVKHDGIEFRMLIFSFVGGTDESVREHMKNLANAAGPLRLQPT